MDAGRKWIFIDEELKTTPNKLDGLSRGEEMNLRYNSALMIQELGERLNLNQLCINTGIVYMHRFYTKQAFSKFPYKIMSAACLFLAAKIEEQPRKMEHVAKTAHNQIFKDEMTDEARHKGVQEMMEEIYDNEQILLSTQGFETVVEHPHSLIVMTCSTIKASKEISHSSYLFATASLFTTTMCIRYSPTIIACACIMTAFKWARIEMPNIEDGKDWFKRLERDISFEELQVLSNELSASVNTYQTKFFKKKAPKFTAKEGHGEPTSKPVALHSATTSHQISQRRSLTSTIPLTEHQNGDKLSHKFCDNKYGPTVEHRKLKPPIKNVDVADTSSRPGQYQVPYRLHQVEVPGTKMSSNQPGFAVPLPPETKPKFDKVPVMPQPEIKKCKPDHQSWPPRPTPADLTPKTESMAHKMLPPTPDTKPSNLPKQPSFNTPLNVLHFPEPKREEYLKEKIAKEHKKEKTRHSEEGEKHKKKSKHHRESKEEHTKKILPMKIKLPPLISSNSSEEFKLKIKEIPKPDQSERAENALHTEPMKERLTMKIGKDMHGNFYQQTQFAAPPTQEQPIHDLSFEHHSRKRKSEHTPMPSKKQRHDRGGHGEVIPNVVPIFPPLPSDFAPSPLPPQL